MTTAARSIDAQRLRAEPLSLSRVGGQSDNVVSLIVVAGSLKGAKMPLTIGQTYSVGSTLDHDIVLRDNADMEFTFQPEANRVSFSTEKATNVELPKHINYGKPVVLGATTVQFENSSPNTTLTSADKTKNSETKSKLPASQILRVGGLVVIGFSLLGVAFSYTGQKQQVQTASTVALESRLADANLVELQIERNENNIVVSGYVATRDQAIRVGEILSQEPASVVNRVLVDEEIKDQITDVLRVNGVEGAVNALGQGSFEAQTTLSSTAEVEQVKALIINDVPSALSFVIENTVPIAAEPDEAAKPPASDSILKAGKRVVMVNWESPAYIVTQDQSRYFVGSPLPGGYRLESIADGRVFVEKDGVTTELSF